MVSFDASPDERSPGLPDSRSQNSRRAASGRSARSRIKAAKTAQLGPESSPPMPTRSGLTPEQPRMRRSSVQLPAHDGGTPSDIDLLRPRGLEEINFEMETPTKKPVRRARAKSSEPASLAGPSPLRQTVSPGTDVVVNQEERRIPRPAFGQSRTSPEMQGEIERRSQRPSVTERSASNPATATKRLSGFQLDGDISKLIKDGPSKDKEKEMEAGCIYLYKIKLRGSEVRLLKIGRTQKHTKKRLKQIRAACGHLEIVEHDKAVAEDIPFHGFAEKLIHTELNNYQHQWLCACGTRHNEYFRVSEDTAVEVFERWRDFCKKEPWDTSGKILPAWGQRLKTRSGFDGPEQNFDHRKFARRWAAFTAPMSFEELSSDAIRVWRSGFPNRWKIVAVVELLTMACISRHSSWTAAWSGIIAILILIDELATENMHTTARISRLMEGGLQSLVLWYMSLNDVKVAETKVLTPKTSPDEALHQPSVEFAVDGPWEESATANDQNPVGVGDPMDVDNDADSQGFVDEKDGSDNGACSPISLETASGQNRVSDREESPDPHAQKSSGRGVETIVIDLTKEESD
ncbi:hypothetical protein CI238_01287 [Colletotrichum incanum]|uniref:Bacteriophage T5 Orf172 DNA-binding domain-containing protein n=1 Tax=Colletotrichum incanum TaxID=1573173 RepID=A0A166ZUN3_COLIC|nr:hypothetical protein CI238_01287 [Colletotrichum incanum]